MAYIQEESLSETYHLPALENYSLRNTSFESSLVCGQAVPFTTLTLTNQDDAIARAFSSFARCNAGSLF